jgi:endonuclease YncB( thermonuclease family)
MWNYRAAVLEVLDGDTVRLLVDTGYHGRQEEDHRLKGVWAPEKNQPGGSETAEFVRGWLASLDRARRWPLEVDTEPNSNPEPDERRSFTRYIAEVRNIATGRSLNEDIRTFLAGHPEWPGGVGAP